MEPYVKQDLKLPQIYAQVKLFKTSLSNQNNNEIRKKRHYMQEETKKGQD